MKQLPKARNRKKSEGSVKASPPVTPSASAVEQIAALAAAGQHARAVEAATAALASARLPVATRLDLLDLRAESYFTQGDVAAAEADAAAMVTAARRNRSAAFLAQALNRRAVVETQRGELRLAVATAEEALAAARQSRQPKLEATSLFRLANALQRYREHGKSVKSAAQAVRLFRKLGDPAGEGRAWQAVAAARNGQGRAADANAAAHKALALAERCGDLIGVGGASNLLAVNELDLALRIRLLQNARAAYTFAGAKLGQASVANNLGGAYLQLGLHRRARRMLRLALDLNRQSGVSPSAAATWNLAETEKGMGNLPEARRYAEASCALWVQVDDALRDAYRPIFYGRIALWEGDFVAAQPLFEEGLHTVQGTDHDTQEIDALIGLAEVALALDHAPAALIATTRATTIHRRHDLAVMDVDPVHLWWLHHRALAANDNPTAARQALAIAYRFVVRQIADVTDEGLRRNFLNKADDNPRVVSAWLADARTRKTGLPKRIPHLQGKSNLREPFERLADTGLRLNELRSASELHEFLIDEATELSGGERVLLVLETPRGPRLAGSLMPKGEDAEMLLASLTPGLQQVQHTRTALLDYAPGRAKALDQRSRIIAPLIAQQQLLGYLYLDIDGAFGRFHDTDRDMMAMLASQAAVALDNAQWAEGLEEKVAQRTEELRASNALIEQRANELALINSIQEGIAAELDFQAIVDLVGNKLREVFATGDMQIRWLDEAATRVHALYCYEHGVRLQTAPSPIRRIDRFLRERGVLVANTRADLAAHGLGVTMPGTDACLCLVGVPIVAGDRVLGSILLENHEREYAFGDSDVRLLSTIASSMGVALENARLFDETQRLLKETQRRGREATALADVGRDLSSSLDLATVMDRIATHAKDLLAASDSAIFLPAPDGRSYRAIVALGTSADEIKATSIVAGEGIIGKLLQSGKAELINDTQADPRAVQIPGTAPQRDERMMVVPLLSGDQVQGAMAVWRTGDNPFESYELEFLVGLSRQAAVALRNARLFNETQEALARQTATANVLRAISRSTFDIDAVLDTLVSTAARLCHAWFGIMFKVDGDVFRPVARVGATPALFEHLRNHPLSVRDQDSVTSRALAAGHAVQVEDAADVRAYGRGDVQQVGAYRTLLAVPILRESVAIGVLTLGRSEVRLYSEKEVELVTSFADQAAIAMENVRLFNETKEALERQTATAEILKVISSSPTDTQPVFDAIVASAARLFGRKAALRTVEDGGLRRRARSYGASDEFHGADLMPIDRDSLVGRAVIECTAQQDADTRAPAATPYAHAHAEQLAFRSIASAPLVRDGAAIGVISVSSPEPGALSDKQMALLATFADQAVIAIENARLFKETQDALANQTATADILRVISSSPTSVQPVFDAIVGTAVRLLACDLTVVVLRKGNEQSMVAGATRDRSPIGISPGTTAIDPADNFPSRVFATGRMLHLPDWTAVELPERERRIHASSGMTASLMVPMVRDGECIGVLVFGRKTPGPFRDTEIALAESFADQALIAIENVRLFDETNEALERQTATAEILRVISGSVTDTQPVFDAIVASCQRLFAGKAVALVVPNGPLLESVAYSDDTGAARGPGMLRPWPLDSGSGAGTCILESRVVNVADTIEGAKEFARMRDLAIALGYKSCLFVPLLRDGRAIGCITILRATAGRFDDQEVALAQTFADQAVIAIQNARLFNETNEALASQTASADILRVISSSPTDVQPVFDAIVTTAVKRLDCDIAIVQICSGDTYSPKAMATSAGLTPVPGSTVMPVDPDANFPSRAIVSKTMLHLRDWSAIALPAHEQIRHEQLGLNSTLYLPLLRGDACAGVLVLGNKRANAFSDKAIALAESFRDQAVIAIENVRLFNDTKESLERQTATARILSAMSGSIDGHAAGLRCDRGELPHAVRGQRRGDAPGPRRRAPRRGEHRHGLRARPARPGERRGYLRARGAHDPHPRPGSGGDAVSANTEHGAQAGIPLGDLRAAAARARRGAGDDRRVPARCKRLQREGRRAARNVRRSGGHRHRERAAVQRGTAGARRRGGRQRSEEQLPRHDEPRDPDSDERGDRHERPAARHAARR